jgi:hypothetical protein
MAWLKSHWKSLTAGIVVIVVVLAIVGLIFTQPWSKIVVYADNQYSYEVIVGIYIDGEFVGQQTVGHDLTIDFQGEYSVKQGTHTVGVEFSIYGGLTGVPNYLSTVKVGPFSTSEVWVHS